MRQKPYGRTVTEMPNDLDVVTTREFEAPIALVFEVLTKPAHVSECSFRGTYLEVEPPTRTVATWLFEGWPDVDAVESVDLHDADGVTKLTTKLAFRDKAGRDHMTKSDGQEDSFDKMEDHLRSLLDPEGAVSGS